MIPCANINVQAVWPTTVVNLLYLLQLLLCTLPAAQYDFTAAHVCVCGGGGGGHSFSLSLPFSRSLPHSSLARCRALYTDISNLSYFPKSVSYNLFFSESSPHTE